MLSEKPWSAEAAARLFLGVIATLCLGLALTGLAQEPWLGLTAGQRRLAGEIIMVLFFNVGTMVWIGFFLRGQNLSWDEAFGFVSRQRQRALLFGLAGGVIFLPPVIGLQFVAAKIMTFFHVTPTAQTVVEQLRAPLPLGQKIFLGLLAVALAPVAEETFFRGILYPTLKQAWKPRMAIVATSLLFAATHVNLATFAPLLVLSVLLILLYEETDNLLAPILAHSVFNATNFIVLLIGGGGD